MNKDLEERYLNVINDNVNVGKSNPMAEFIILLAGLAVLFMFLYFFADVLGCFFIDRMSDKTQMKIENAFSFGINPKMYQTTNDTKRLEKIRDKIVPLDKKLQGKSKFPKRYKRLCNSEWYNILYQRSFDSNKR